MPALAKKPTKTSRTAKRARSGGNRPSESPDGMWERIREKAYELWVRRGCREGDDLRDWLDAEAIVMDEVHEARE